MITSPQCDSVRLRRTYEQINEQEYIPVGCLPPASMAISVGGVQVCVCVCVCVCPGVVSKGVYPPEPAANTPCPIACWDTPPCGQTDTCKNITFPQLLLRGVTKGHVQLSSLSLQSLSPSHFNRTLQLEVPDHSDYCVLRGL